MRELRFHRELYFGESVDAAAKRLEPWADLVRRETATHWIVEETARSPSLERRVAGELANFALGLTIRRGGGLGDAPGV